MNMNKALQNLYHAVSNETTTKVNISKLLVDIHYAITGKESANKNNWSKIINSMADNWPEGGGGTTVEALSVTQNGTYTAPSGKAYSPVTVNVSGGSSDFSTATVTFNNNTDAMFLLSTVIDDGEDVASFPRIKRTRGIAQAILYKGMAFGLVLGEDVNVTTTGAAEYDDGFLYITGDCTITIS